jgi:large subunit ribosomal protein L25
MDKIMVSLSSREARGKANNKLRTEGKTPAVVYGHGSEPQAVAVDTKAIDKVYSQAGGNKIVGLKIDDARMKNARIQDVQTDVRTGHISHVDFYLVKMDEKLKAEIPLHFTGESTAVYQQEGSLIRPLETIEVEALPGDLPENIEVDISVLDDFDKSIHVRDLAIPADVTLITPEDEVVAKVDPPRSDEELEDLDSEIDEKAEMPEGALEDTEVVDEADEGTRKEAQDKAAGADPAASK